MAGSPQSKNKNKAHKTPDDGYDHHEDARKQKGSGTYPNQWVYKSRSGHSMIFDDSQGNESITLQHRSGSALQMLPDGSVQITAHNSLYTMVFAENRVTVTGAQDVTVKGDCSLRVFGELNETVHGNYNLTVLGDYNMTAKNHNRQVRGSIDTHAKNETKKLEGSSAMTAQGGIAMVAAKSAGMYSQGDQLHFGAASGINHTVRNGNMTSNIEEQGNFHMQAKQGEFNLKTKQHIKATSEQGDLNMEAQKGNAGLAAMQKVSIKSSSSDVGIEAQQKAQLVGRQQVGVSGGEAYLTATTGMAHVKAATMTNVDAGTKVNLGSDATDFSIFDLFKVAQAQGQTGQASQVPQPMAEENDVEQWNKSVGGVGTIA